MEEKMLECRGCGTRKWSVLEGPKANELRTTGSVRLPCPACGEYKSWKESDYDWRAGGVKQGAAENVSYSIDRRAETIDPPAGVPRESPVSAVATAVLAASDVPANLPVKSSRRHQRVRLELSVRVRVDSPTLEFSEVAKSLNVSRSGIFFLSDRPYRQGLIAHVVLSYSPESPYAPVEHDAVVIRVEPGKEDGKSGVALMML